MIGDKDWNWGMTMETQIDHLLAEVKRLREGIKVYLKITDERPHNYIHENREKLRELIE